jgi:Flp pilus assembly pilin Flp
MMFRKRKQKGAALVEYGLLVAGVALVATAAVSIFGTKTSDLIASVATVLPGAQPKDNAPLQSGQLVETTDAVDSTTPIELDVVDIVNASNTSRMSTNIGSDFTGLILDTQ